jgi:hypothetical protein
MWRIPVAASTISLAFRPKTQTAIMLHTSVSQWAATNAPICSCDAGNITKGTNRQGQLKT